MAFENWDDKNGSQPEEEKQEEKSFEEMTDDELLDCMKSESWAQYDEGKKVDCIQEMENRNAAAQGREPATVVSLNSSQYAGQYNPSSNEIYVNVNAMSSYEVLDTYVHESNHAVQYDAVAKGEGYDTHTQTMMATEYTPGNYTEKDSLYDVQCTEMDSNNKAADFVAAQKERYQDDPEYRAYIKSRDEHFKEVQKFMDENPEARKEMQNEQLMNSFMQGRISREEYVNALQNVNNENFKDSTVQERENVAEKIAAMNAELNPEVNNEEESAVSAETEAGATISEGTSAGAVTGGVSDSGPSTGGGTTSESGGVSDSGGVGGDDGGSSNDEGLE